MGGLFGWYGGALLGYLFGVFFFFFLHWVWGNTYYGFVAITTLLLIDTI